MICLKCHEEIPVHTNKCRCGEIAPIAYVVKDIVSVGREGDINENPIFDEVVSYGLLSDMESEQQIERKNLYLEIYLSNDAHENKKIRQFPNLESVYLPEDLTEIGSFTCSDCDNLVHVTIPSTVTEIGQYAFRNTSWLDSLEDEFVIVGDGICLAYHGDKEHLTELLIPEGLKYLCADLFSHAPLLKKVVFPDSLKKIGEKTFQGCKQLVDVIFPPHLTSIGEKAFEKCTVLNNIYLPETLNHLGENAFAGTSFQRRIKKKTTAPTIIQSPSHILLSISGFSKMVIPKEVIHIAYSACFKNHDLTELVIPSTVESLGTSSFEQATHLKSVTFSEQLTIIPYNAFASCESLQQVTLPKKLKKVDFNAFAFCTKLESVILPEGLDSIENGAFQQCESLTHINLPSTMTYLGGGTFKDCTSLERIIIPEGVEVIYNYTFQNCVNLKYILIPKTVKKIQAYAFQGCNDEILLQNDVKSVEDYIFLQERWEDWDKLYYRPPYTLNEWEMFLDGEIDDMMIPPPNDEEEDNYD